MLERLVNYVRAGQPGIVVVSHEETRVERMLKLVAEQTQAKFYVWTQTHGILDHKGKSVQTTDSPLDMLKWLDDAQLDKNGREQVIILAALDFHLQLENAEPVLLRMMKDTLRKAKSQGKCLMIIGCRKVVPPELERELVIVDFTLPTPKDLQLILESLVKSANVQMPAGVELQRIVESASGLTCQEAENAFSLALVEGADAGGGMSPEVVYREKCHEVKKSGLLEVVESNYTLDDIGGLDALKNFLVQRQDVFTEEARKFGLPNPKGVLLVGVPGGGKSLSAKVTAAVFKRPLLRLDGGKLFNSLVGGSEERARQVQGVAEAISPCVLWIDELEKAFAGIGSSGSTDNGTAARVFGSMLTWMQEKTAPVFVVATANNVHALPPELLRRGRFDELFFVDLPNPSERGIIWNIHLKKVRQWEDGGKEAALRCMPELVQASDKWTGGEIEQTVIDAMFIAFSHKRGVRFDDLIQAARSCVPLSSTAAEKIQAMRDWATNRARNASTPAETEVMPTGRRLQM